jgi:capsular exopolysaccharide synthesis family protein
MPNSNAGYGRTGSRSSGEDHSLIRYWTVVRERVWLIAACTALVFLASVAYVALAPRTYTAQAEVEVQAAASGDAVLSALPVLHQTGDPTEDVLTAASLVTTQPVADAVVSDSHLGISAGEALGDVSATPIGQAGLIAIQAQASSPELAQRLANGFAAQTIALSTARMHAAIQRELPTLQSELAGVPRAQRYGPGSLGEQVDELQQLLHQNDPTLVLAAPATLPTAASSPKTKVSLVAGLLGGLLVGIGAAFILHALDPRVRREDQLRERFGVPILARIPRQERRQKTPRPLLPYELSPGGQEGYRTLRTTLAARSRSSEPRAFLVTGSAPAEGKSTTAMGLAGALAHAGARVIMIEADLRKPTFAQTFGLDRFVGTEHVLSGDVDLADALVRVEIEDADVRILAAHPSAGDAVGGLSFGAVAQLVVDAKAVADYVVIDSAPLTEVIDALPFAQSADEVLIVARLDQTRIAKVDELYDLLSENGIKRMGLVLIGEHPMRRTPYYYGDSNGAPRPLPAPVGVEPEQPSRRVLRG